MPLPQGSAPALRCALFALCTVTALPAQARPGQNPQGQPPAPSPPPKQAPLGQQATEVLVRTYRDADQWAMQAIALLSLGPSWHPAGAEIVLQALQGKEARLLPFGIETLRRMDRDALPAVATAPLLAELIENTLRHKNALVQERTLDVLQRIVQDGPKDRAGWQAWWRQNEATYAPKPWTPPDGQPKGPGTVAGTLVERAFDLRDAGLQVAIVIDSTGSMQVAIDTCRDAIEDVVALLAGIAPKFELGLVHYKDFGDMSDGAKVLVPLNKDRDKVRDKLGKLTASGGGDVPERVEKGIEAALSREMRWDKDKNRLVLVVGDAPPHPETQTALLEVVKAAHERPFQDPRKPTTGKGEKLRPFVFSCIATQQQAKIWFDEIAAAGGGASVLLAVSDQGRERAVQAVVRHILLQSFGGGYEAQLAAFADTFFEYRAAGAF